MTTVVWFRRDLRLQDNPALNAALARASSNDSNTEPCILPVYIYAPEEEAPWQPGAASRCWLHNSLESLHRDLAELGLPLLILRGGSLEVLSAVIEHSGADAVYWNRLYEPACIARDTEVKTALLERGIEAQSFNSALLLEPWSLSTKAGTPFKVFTPFWKAAMAQLQQDPPVAAPLDTAVMRGGLDFAVNKLVQPLASNLSEYYCEAVAELELLPQLDWHQGMMSHWQVGEAAAQQQLKLFVQSALADYDGDRDIPSVPGTSRLSPHLHFGEISPRQIWQAIEAMPLELGAEAATTELAETSRRRYLAELGWREFAHHLLFHFPHTAEQSLNPKYHYFPWWRSDVERDTSWQGAAGAQALARWQRGETGISLIDAGMQELWQSGWMHNRVRMVVASLLCKNLGVHWIEGARWFWDTLVDANLANNTLGWQWAAGCGADAAPYFRIFNPDTQAQRFDPQAEYRHSWLAEGWQQRETTVDLRESRKQALDAYESIKNLTLESLNES